MLVVEAGIVGRKPGRASGREWEFGGRIEYAGDSARDCNVPVHLFDPCWES